MQDFLQTSQTENNSDEFNLTSFLVNDSPLAMYTCDKKGHVNFFNPAAAKLWGRSPEIGKDLWCGSWKIFYPDGKLMPADMCPMAQIIKDGVSFESAEMTIERPDHSLRNLLVFPRAILNRENELLGAYNTLVDITDQKSGEEKQAILSAIVESSDDAIISKNLNGIITSWNKGAEKIFGYREDEVVGKHISILIPLALRSEEDIIIGNIKAGNKIDHFPTIRLHKSGRELNISLTVSPIKNAMNKVIGASKIARDISEQLLAEKKIKRNAEQLVILNSISKTISEKLEISSILQHVVEASSKLTGAAFGIFFYNAFTEKGQSMVVSVAGEALESLGDYYLAAQINPSLLESVGKNTFRINDIQNEQGHLSNESIQAVIEKLNLSSYMSVPVRTSSGAVTGGIILGHTKPGMFTDDHEKLIENISSLAAVALYNSKLIEDITALSAKKDEFIALASHELKTPLTSVKGYLQFLRKLTADAAGAPLVEKALLQVDKLHSLIADLLDISRIKAGKLSLNMAEFALADLIDEVIANVAYTVTSHKIVFANKDSEITVLGDHHRLEQVLVNLLTNAIKYSPADTRIWVSLKTIKDTTFVYVKDEGMGLNEEQQKDVFTRFYRAEGTNHIAGLGLGLYLSENIVKQHGGSIGVNSVPGKGAEFWFSIPAKN